MNRLWLLVTGLWTVLLLLGCGITPPPTPTPGGITIKLRPPCAFFTNEVRKIGATVSQFQDGATIEWSISGGGGAIVPDSANPASATYTAPGQSGAVTIIVTAKVDSKTVNEDRIECSIVTPPTVNAPTPVPDSPLPTPPPTPTPLPPLRFVGPDNQAAVAPRTAKVEWDPNPDGLAAEIRFYRNKHLIGVFPNAIPGDVGVASLPGGDLVMELWFAGSGQASAAVTFKLAPPATCLEARFTVPDGIRLVEPEGGQLTNTPRNTKIEWEPAGCEMDLQFYQRSWAGPKKYIAKSGQMDFTLLDENGQTEVKIWVQGETNAADAMQVQVVP